MNRKIILSAISIVSALSLLGGAAFAFFSDVGNSNDNLFAAGTFDLKLSDDTPETDQDNVVASFGGTNFAPGSCTTVQELRLKNSGSVAGNHVDITEANSNPGMAAFLRIDSLTYDSVDVLPKVLESGNNSFKDLADWAASPSGVVDLALTDLGTDHKLDMKVCLDETAGNPLQGGVNYATFSATLRQQGHASE